MPEQPGNAARTVNANTANLKRLRTLIVAIPVAVGMGYGLYQRLILGIEQKHFSDELAKRAQSSEPSEPSEPARMNTRST